MTDRLDVLREIAAGFDTHDLDRILRHFADDAVFESPRGPEAYGQRFVGIEAIREAFAARFTGIPDVRYLEDDHFVAAIAERRNGPCAAPPPMACASRSEGATCGPSAAARSSRRTRTGSSARPDRAAERETRCRQAGLTTGRPTFRAADARRSS